MAVSRRRFNRSRYSCAEADARDCRMFIEWWIFMCMSPGVIILGNRLGFGLRLNCGFCRSCVRPSLAGDFDVMLARSALCFPGSGFSAFRADFFMGCHSSPHLYYTSGCDSTVIFRFFRLFKSILRHVRLMVGMSVFVAMRFRLVNVKISGWRVIPAS
jgi:hypothetical protein